MDTPAPATGAGGNATWAAQPSSGDWNTAANWVPAGVPTNTAAFGPSSQTQIGFGPGTSATVAGIAFVSGAPPYAFVFGGGEVSFSDSASAGTARFTVYGSTSTTDGDTFGNVVFHDTSTAAGGTFTNAGGTVAGGDGGNTQFYDDATAGSGKY